MSSSSNTSGSKVVQDSSGGTATNSEQNGYINETPDDGFRLPPSIEDPEDDSGYETDYGRPFVGSL